MNRLTVQWNLPNSRTSCIMNLFVEFFYVYSSQKILDDKRGKYMARRCELTGKGPMSGNNVSHAKNRTKRRFLPNLNDVTLQSEVLGRGVKLRISAAALRTVDHRGGLDAFFAKSRNEDLSDRALKLKKEILKTQNSEA